MIQSHHYLFANTIYKFIFYHGAHHHHCRLSGGRHCASNPWSRLIALSHCSRRGVSDRIRGFIHVSRGLPRGVSTKGRGNDQCEVGLQSTELCLQAHPLLVWLESGRYRSHIFGAWWPARALIVTIPLT